MQVSPLSEALGVELCDFDITRPCSADVQAELRKLFSEYHLLLVRGQDLTGEDQDRFVSYFGPLRRGPEERKTYITNKNPASVENTGHGMLVWHSDGMYERQPWIAASLWAIEVSPKATPTLFANGVRALDRLPADLRAQVESLHVLYFKPYMESEVTYRPVRQVDIPSEAWLARGEHPLVYRLPHIQKETLFVDEMNTRSIVELSSDEGEVLLQKLHKHLYGQDNVYSHTWKTKDIIIWDNIALQHSRPEAMGTETRHLRRQAIRGWITDDGVLDWSPVGSTRAD